MASESPARNGSVSPLVSRARFLALVGIGGILGYGGMRIGGRTVKGWRYNTVESQIPSFDRSTYTLKVDGLIENPFTVTYDELRALPSIHQVSDFRCVEGWGVDDVRWDGVRMQYIIDRARPAKEAKFITFHSMRGIYRDSLSMEQASLPDCLIAYDMDGTPLAPGHGMPLRVVMPRMFGYKGAKWLHRIEFRDEQDIGYWEQRGWRVDAWIKA
jgi:DMSO/TMAO reductase YedYZ molybdopterin-dependent catalytic subunit